MSKTTVRLNLKPLQQLRRELEPRAQALIDKVSFDVQSDAQDRAPVRTGFLKSTIHVEVGRLLNKVAVGAEYAIYQEFGTRFMAAHPFLVPALERHRKAFYAAWKQLVK